MGDSSYVSTLQNTQCTPYAEQLHPLYAVVLLLVIVVTIWIVGLQQSFDSMSLFPYVQARVNLAFLSSKF